MSTTEISNSEFEKIRNLIQKISGIFITDAKRYLIQSRLENLLQTSNLKTYTLLCHEIEKGNEDLKNELIDLMTTNESLWFRDVHPFEIFANELLPQWCEKIEKGEKEKIRIWCSACSSGQEPYSLAMSLCEQKRKHRNINPDSFKILGTDISTEILAYAKEGQYDSFAMSRGLSSELKERYFHSEGRYWVVNDEVKDFVDFQRGNLQDSYQSLGLFDAIFCRNVIIYFNDEFKKSIFEKFKGSLTSEGVLFLGASETIGLYSDAFEQVKSTTTNGYYYKVQGL